MARAKRQRQYKRGTTYIITGPTEREGKFKLKSVPFGLQNRVRVSVASIFSELSSV